MIVVLVVVFGLAAVAKAIRPRATARELAALRLPWPRVLARVVPAVELSVVAALVAEPAWGAAAAAALLACFTLLLVDVVRSGRVVSCGCLGPLDRRPVTWTTVSRNLALVAVAGLAVTVPALRLPPVDGPTLMALALVAVPVGLIVAVGAQLLSLRHTVGHLWSHPSPHPSPHPHPPLPVGGPNGRNPR